jgi:hypothetical protein
MNGQDDKSNKDEELRESIELTPSEKKAMETLPRERIPNAAWEDRMVDVLRSRGAFAPRRRRVIELTPRRIAIAVAASLALLVGGFALGQWAGGRQAGTDEFLAHDTPDISVAATLQQAGSAYVMALQSFADLPDSINGAQAVQGREVALTTLYTAADQVTRLVPKDELARQLLAAIDTYPATQTPIVGPTWPGTGTQVIEF